MASKGLCSLHSTPCLREGDLQAEVVVLCDLGQFTPLTDSVGVSISKGRRRGLKETALLQGLTPGRQECAQAPEAGHPGLGPGLPGPQ